MLVICTENSIFAAYNLPMTITIPYIKQRFDEFNARMFEGKLPPIPIKLSNAKGFLGACSYKKKRSLLGGVTYSDFTLRISTRIDLPEDVVEDTIIHEMIHYYIFYFQLKDTSSHGQIFRSIMNSINARFGRHITISHKMTAEQREQTVDTRRRWHVVAVVNFYDGRKGVKVLPCIVQRITNYYKKVIAARQVAAIELYMTSDPFFNRFPCSSALNVCFHDENEVAEHLRGAERMECDGKEIRRA